MVLLEVHGLGKHFADAQRHGEAPWIGFGYGRGILDLQFRMGVTPGVDNPKHAHAHNTALNVLLQGGVVG